MYVSEKTNSHRGITSDSAPYLANGNSNVGFSEDIRRPEFTV